MSEISRRAILRGGAGVGAALLFAGCTTQEARVAQPRPAPALTPVPPGVSPSYGLMYGPIYTERFPIPAVNLATVNPAFLRAQIDYVTDEAPGTIIVDPNARYLYYVEPGNRATRYGVGVGKEGFGWSGVATVNSKQEWPDWYPPAEMLARRPDIVPQLVRLQSGMGVPGGLSNPIGARGLYLWQNGKDTLYRIHGTNEPHTIGTSVSSGCIRMINQDAIHLYERVPVGTEVKVLPAGVA